MGVLSLKESNQNEIFYLNFIPTTKTENCNITSNT